MSNVRNGKRLHHIGLMRAADTGPQYSNTIEYSGYGPEKATRYQGFADTR